jgi:transmembrane sensor
MRKVTVNGEAFFDVKHGDKPFVVSTGEARITDLGTRFDVWARDHRTRVVVEEGLVRLDRSGSEAGVILAKDQISSIADGRVPEAPSTVNAERMLGWLSGRLVFDRTPFSEIIGELERTFNVHVALADTGLARKTVTADFRNPSLETVLASLCMTMNAKYRVASGHYIISSE